MYAVVRLRGSIDVRKQIKDTLKMLRLHKVNHCVIVEENAYYEGMLKKVKDYVAWGEVSEEILELLLRRKGRLEGGGRLTEGYLKENTPFSSIKDIAHALYEGEIKMKDLANFKIKPLLRLHPPRKGHRGIKRSFKAGGELGYHGEGINKLLYKMR